MRTLVIGYGNGLRGDDGVGFEVAARLEARRIEGVEVRAVGQLQLEWAAEWANYDRVVLVDAAVDGAPVTRERVWPVEGGRSEALSEVTTHHVNPETLLRLTRVLYGGAPEVYRYRIRAESFECGRELTPTVRAAAELAVEQIVRLVGREAVRDVDKERSPGSGVGQPAIITSV
jgi:hydrogenase maturation protease